MIDVLTLTLNPSLDLSATTDRVVPGLKLRLTAPVAEPGGGGINVARAVQALGGRARAVTALGGATGDRLRALIETAGVPLSVFDLPGESRQSLAVTEASSGQQYRFVLPGPEWDATRLGSLLERLEDDVRRMGAGGGGAVQGAGTSRGPGPVVVLSGSQPPGVPPDFPQVLARRLTGARLVVDTSGAALETLVRSPMPGAMPHVLRMDRAESEALAGRGLARAADSLDFAAELIARGVARTIILARGAEGSGLVSATDRLFCAPPPVDVVSAVGAGDSFVAGFALALARGYEPETALRMGTAAAAAAVMTPGTELCRGADAARLLGACRLLAHDVPHP